MFVLVANYDNFLPVSYSVSLQMFVYDLRKRMRFFLTIDFPENGPEIDIAEQFVTDDHRPNEEIPKLRRTPVEEEEERLSVIALRARTTKNTD